MPSTVDRVLPWRRTERPPADEVAPLLAAYRARHPKAPTTRISPSRHSLSSVSVVSNALRLSLVEI